MPTGSGHASGSVVIAQPVSSRTNSRWAVERAPNEDGAMSQPARKPGDPGSSKFGNSLPADDPSIPVLTERLTLPPLDLNLEFRVPERPATPEANPAPIVDVPIEPLTPIETRGRIEPRGIERDGEAAEESEVVDEADESDELEEILEPEPTTIGAPPDDGPVDEDRLTTVMGPVTSVEPPEATVAAPRVPTSLLISNVDTLLATPPGATPYQERDGFDLTQPDGSRADPTATDLREMILLELARRLPTEVEAIVGRHLEGAIDEAIRRFGAEVRIALAGSLREMVDRAVKTELDRLKVPRS